MTKTGSGDTPLEDRMRGYELTHKLVTVKRSEWAVDINIPIFTKDRSYIESLMGDGAGV